MDWFDLLAVQGILKSLLQHHRILWHSAFFTVQLLHPYMTTGKTKVLTRQTFVGKVMSLLFTMLSRLVIAFLPRIKSFNFMAVVSICSDFGAQKYCFHCFSIYLPWSDGTRCHDLGLSQLFHSPLSLSSKGSLFFFTFCHKGGVICISEVIDISPGNLDSHCASSNPAFHMMYSAYKLNKQGDNI